MRLALLVLISCLTFPSISMAHAFGQQYNLPLPANLYIIGGSLALIFSFVLLVISPPKTKEDKRAILLIGPELTGRIITTLRRGATGLLFLTIFVGLAGSQTPTNSLAPYLFWIFFLLGFAYVSVLISGLWEEINPFCLEVSFLRHEEPDLRLNKKWFHLPILGLYAGLIWIELLSGGLGAVPSYIAIGLLGYLVFSWLIIDRYGKGVWEENFDVFGAFFRLMGLLAPIRVSDEGVYWKKSKPTSSSLGWVLFILVVLSLTAFDGIRETDVYIQNLAPLSMYVPYALLETMAFLFFPSFFFAIYAACMSLVKRLGKLKLPLRELLIVYGPSLIPIAIVYHFAHYFTLLLVEGQNLVKLLSDPLGFGWNLFGTANYNVNIGIIGADTIWYIQLSVIVLGHIIALFLSHKITWNLIGDRKRVILAELPLLMTMVFYTAFGLWILSRPFAL